MDNQLGYPPKKTPLVALHNMWKTDWLVLDYILFNQDSTPKKGVSGYKRNLRWAHNSHSFIWVNGKPQVIGEL